MRYYVTFRAQLKPSLCSLAKILLPALVLSLVAACSEDPVVTPKKHTPTCSLAVLKGPIVNPANGHTYYMLDNSNWSDAEACAVNAYGGHLVTINDAAENTFVLTTFAQFYADGRVWLGLNDAATEGTFVYSSGEAFAYSYWESGEPNNSSDEDYVMMYANNGRWNDVQDLANPPGIGEIYGVVEVE